MAKNSRDAGDAAEVQPDAPLPSELPPVAECDREDEREDAVDREGDGLVAVVVRKGHTLYHDGEKYPATSRVRMSEVEAGHLKKRGVVLLYSDLLEQVADYAG